MSLLDRYYDIRDQAVGWWNTVAATAGSERLAKRAARYDRGQCMYDHPDGRWCPGVQTAGTPYCVLHLSEHIWDPDLDADPDLDRADGHDPH